jgi:hypothetical protein
MGDEAAAPAGKPPTGIGRKGLRVYPHIANWVVMMIVRSSPKNSSHKGM